MWYKPVSNFINSNLRALLHQWNPTSSKQSGPWVETMSGSNTNQRLSQSCNLNLKPVDLLHILSNCVVTAFFLHVGECSETGAVWKHLTFVWCHVNSWDILVNIHRRNTTVNFIDEAGSHHVVPVFPIEFNNSQTSVELTIYILLKHSLLLTFRQLYLPRYVFHLFS